VDTIPGGYGVTGTFGGQAIGIDGKLYGIPNNATTGTLYGIDLTTGVADSVFSFSGGPPGGNADMASFICDAVDAKFIPSPDSVCVGQTIQFSDISTGFPDSWLWDLGDPASGTADTS